MSRFSFFILMYCIFMVHYRKIVRGIKMVKNHNHIGSTLKKIREMRGLTQEQLGKCCNLSQARVAQYETGNRVPKEQQLQQIAQSLNVDMDVFHNTDIDPDNPEAIRQLLFQLYEQGLFDLQHSFSKCKSDRGDGNEQFYLTIPIDRDLALFIEQWRTITHTVINAKGETISYDKWKYDRQKRECANEIINEKLSKKDFYRYLFKTNQAKEKTENK